MKAFGVLTIECGKAILPLAKQKSFSVGGSGLADGQYLVHGELLSVGGKLSLLLDTAQPFSGIQTFLTCAGTADDSGRIAEIGLSCDLRGQFVGNIAAISGKRIYFSAVKGLSAPNISRVTAPVQAKAAPAVEEPAAPVQAQFALESAPAENAASTPVEVTASVIEAAPAEETTPAVMLSPSEQPAPVVEMPVEEEPEQPASEVQESAQPETPAKPSGFVILNSRVPEPFPVVSDSIPGLVPVIRQKPVPARPPINRTSTVAAAPSRAVEAKVPVPVVTAPAAPAPVDSMIPPPDSDKAGSIGWEDVETF